MVQGIIMMLVLICLVLSVVFVFKIVRKEYVSFVDDFTGLKSIQSIAAGSGVSKLMNFMYVFGLLASILSRVDGWIGKAFEFVAGLIPFVIAVTPIIIEECFCSKQESSKIIRKFTSFVRKSLSSDYKKYKRREGGPNLINNVELLYKLLFSSGFLYLMIGTEVWGTFIILGILHVTRICRRKYAEYAGNIQVLAYLVVGAIIVLSGNGNSDAIATVLFVSATILWILDELGRRYTGELSIGTMVLLVVAIVMLCGIAEFGEVPLSNELRKLLNVLEYWLR